MKKPYCCESSQYLFDQYYTQQQKGYGGDIPVYLGRASQRGHGLANIFRKIWSFLFPAIKTMTPHVLRTGADIVEGVASGKTWKDSASKHASSVLIKVPDAISAGIEGFKNQSGAGIRRKKTAKRRRGSKKRKRDIFS
jgi:hypothetical protein